MKVILQTTEILRWEISDSLFWCARYIQAVNVSQWFFLQPTQQASLYCFSKIYTKWFYCEAARNYGLKFYTKRFICLSIKRFISVIFLSTIVAFSILFRDFEIFLHIPIWAPTRFPKVIYPRYNPDLSYLSKLLTKLFD